jgi:hypothetical protein
MAHRQKDLLWFFFRFIGNKSWVQGAVGTKDQGRGRQGTNAEGW